MQIKKPEWSEWRNGVHATTNLPHFLYDIRLAAEGQYGVRFYAGWIDNGPPALYTSASLEECKLFAEQHWVKYVTENFLEEQH